MGWCSGTGVFDPVARSILNRIKDKKVASALIMDLTVALEDMDWDCQYESDLSENPIVKEVWRKLHPDWDEE